MSHEHQLLWFISLGSLLCGCTTMEVSGGDCPEAEPFEVNLTLTEGDVQSVVGESWMAGDALSEEMCDNLCKANVDPKGKQVQIESCDAAWFEGDDDVSGLSFSCDGTLQLICL